MDASRERLKKMKGVEKKQRIGNNRERQKDVKL